jgi:hypothetical protein
VSAIAPPRHQTPVFGCPQGVGKFLSGRKFDGVTDDGAPCGTIGITADGTAYGFGPFQRMSAWDPGDIIIMKFDLSESTVHLSIGSEELLDEYAEGMESGG